MDLSHVDDAGDVPRPLLRAENDDPEAALLSRHAQIRRHEIAALVRLDDDDVAAVVHVGVEDDLRPCRSIVLAARVGEDVALAVDAEPGLDDARLVGALLRRDRGIDPDPATREAVRPYAARVVDPGLVRDRVLALGEHLAIEVLAPLRRSAEFRLEIFDDAGAEVRGVVARRPAHDEVLVRLLLRALEQLEKDRMTPLRVRIPEEPRVADARREDEVRVRLEACGDGPRLHLGEPREIVLAAADRPRDLRCSDLGARTVRPDEDLRRRFEVRLEPRRRRRDEPAPPFDLHLDGLVEVLRAESDRASAPGVDLFVDVLGARARLPEPARPEKPPRAERAARRELPRPRPEAAPVVLERGELDDGQLVEQLVEDRVRARHSDSRDEVLDERLRRRECDDAHDRAPARSTRSTYL